MRSDHSNAPTITLITGEEAEATQAAIWRPIAWKWPAFAPSPSLQLLKVDQALEGTPVTGAVALLASSAFPDPAALFRLMDRLLDSSVPIVVLAGPECPLASRAAMWEHGPLVLPEASDPAVIASALMALAHRQGAVESLAAEVSIVRRYQGGLRGEIDKIHDELQLAASVQREFLPRQLPSVPNIDVQVLFRPCGYVSGDIYDVQKLSEHEIGFFVADAVGHGVPAALMTMVLCRCLTTTVCEGGCQRSLRPGQVLQQLNQDLIRRHGESSSFATAVYGIIDTRTRRVAVAGAGHPYPLRVSREGVIRLETTGSILGVFPDDEFSEVEFTMGEEEMLIVYSDGFETAFPALEADAFGRRRPNTNYVDRFVSLFEGWRERGLGSSVRALGEQIDGQTGSLHQHDDLTAMFIVPAGSRPLDRLFLGELEGGTRDDRPPVRDRAIVG